MSEVGRCRLRLLLAQRNMSQRELSEKSGVSHQQISDYVNNRRVMSLRNARAISLVLRCRSIDDLYDWQDSEGNSN